MYYTVYQHQVVRALDPTFEVLRRHGLDPARHAEDVASLLSHPAVERLFHLLEAAGRGEDVAAEGDERLRLSLALVLALVEHATDTATRAGGAETAALKRAREGLLFALGEPAR